VNAPNSYKLLFRGFGNKQVALLSQRGRAMFRVCQ